MAHEFVVAVDYSPDSWRAFDAGLALAARTGGEVRVVHVAEGPLDSRQANRELQQELNRRSPFDVTVTIEVRISTGSVAGSLNTLVTSRPGAVLVMASRGRGRSSALIGSTAEAVLRRGAGPIVLVGPNAHPNAMSGPVVATVDGSLESESALPIATEWARLLDVATWIVTVTHPADQPRGTDADLSGSGTVERLAKGLRATSGRQVEFDQLTDRHAGNAVASYAERHRASLIVASSHGRSGISRLALGSVVARFVRMSACPVVVVRLRPPGSTADERQKDAT